MSKKRSVLFVCGHNSIRSQIAEAWCNHLFGDEFEAESAGVEEAREVNPLAVEAMKEVGIDISQHVVQRVFTLFQEGRMFAYVITICDEATAERCPIFAGVTRQIHWDLPDPASMEGTYQEKLQATREIRDVLRHKIEEWANERSTKSKALRLGA